MRWIAGRWSSGAHQGLGLNASGSRCKMASGDVNPVVGLITPRRRELYGSPHTVLG